MQLLVNDQPIEGAALQEWQPAEFACTLSEAVGLELRVAGTLLEPFLRPGDGAWRWRWNPQNSVGLVEVVLRDTTGHEQRYALRVLPRKLSYEHYTLLLEALQQDAAGLVAALTGGSEGMALSRQPGRTLSALESFAAFVEGPLEPLQRAITQIAAQPHSTLRSQQQSVALAEARGLDDAALAELPRGPFDLAPPEVAPALQQRLMAGGGLLPRRLNQRGSATSYDSYENRLVAALLDALLRRTRQVATVAQAEQRRLARNATLLGSDNPQAVRLEAIMHSCATAERRLRRLRRLPFLNDVGPLNANHGATQLLCRHPAYRQVYQQWQKLQQAPTIALQSPLFHLPLQDLPALYEAWCAVQTAHALLALPGWHPATQQSPWVQPSSSGLRFQLPEDVPLLAMQRGNESLVLRYQPRYRPRKSDKSRVIRDKQAVISEAGAQSSALSPQSSTLVSLDRHTRVPDLAIEWRQHGALPQVLVLDAKYRLDATGGVPEDALADAYAYRGSIGTASGVAAVLAALLLFPGHGSAEFYASGVGALPLLPGNERVLTTWLAQMLNA